MFYGNDVFRITSIVIKPLNKLMTSRPIWLSLTLSAFCLYKEALLMLFFLDLLIIVGGGALILFLFSKIKVPALIGYLLMGILINAVSLMDPNLEAISPYIRKIALVIILIKAGLTLDISDLKKVGRPAVMMSFMPAVVEMVTVGLVAPLFFPLTYIESFTLGAVLGAVSPAVVIPMMSKLIEKKRGTNHGVPQLILAGSSIDDIVMIVFYQAFISIESGGSINVMTFLNIGIAIISGITVGILLGLVLAVIFKKISIDNIVKLLFIIALGIGLTAFEMFLSQWFIFSSLLAVITMCLVVRIKDKTLATNLMQITSKVWIPAEMFLFFLVGASIKVEYATKYFLPALALLGISLVMRSLMVSTCLIKTKLNAKERIFTVISYLPKATVQASIGGGLLDLGNQMLSEGLANAEVVIAAGTIVLSVSVLSILVTAPLSALTMNLTYTKLLPDDAYQTTLDAYKEVENMESNPNDSDTFKSVDELIDDLNK